MTPEAKEALRKLLVREEGLRLSAYQDSEGYWTIGVGRLIDARRNGGITQAEAMHLLINDIDKVEREVLAMLPWVASLDTVRQRVLYAMAFQIGTQGLLKFKTTLAHVQAGRWMQAAVSMLESLWAEQTGARARRMAHLMETGVDA